MHSTPLDGKQSCSMPRCGRSSCFHARLEVAGSKESGRYSCGTHLADIVQELAARAREQPRRPARVAVYATADGPRANEAGPFDRLALGTIPV